MSEANYDTSILDSLTMGDPISQHHGVKCCPAIRESTDERYIVKILSIPASQVQLDALLLTGAYSTPAHALEYFHKLSEEVLEEVETLKRLHSMEGFLPFTHAEIRKNEDGTGYQVYLVSPYKRSLERQMQLQPLTHLGAVNLGLDLCAALAICRRAGFLYVDLKPSNIFITPNQGYRISDLGFIPMNSLKYASFPEQYRSHYTAPEIADAMSSLNNRIDIYALGLILYQVYNNGELPLEAMASGAPLPPPAYADYEIAEIILKACDPDPEKRWEDPLQMGQSIVAYMQRNSVNDTPIVPPPVEVIPEPVAEEPAEAEIAEDSAAPEEAVVSEETVVAEENVVAEETVVSEAPETADNEDSILDSILEDIPALAADAKETPDSDALVAELNQILLNQEAPAAEPETAQLDLSFINAEEEDETVPTEESAADIEEEIVSEEVQEILARADELISHELPEPAVAPEPIDVPFPAPIILPDEPTEETVENETAASDEEEADEAAPVVILPPEGSDGEAEELAEEDEDPEENEDWSEDDPGAQFSEYYSDSDGHGSGRPRWVKTLVIIASCIALLAALVAGGILFYQYYYLQTVDALIIDGSVDSLTVVIDSSIKDDLLTVTCTDTYGNTRTQEVINGRVHFTNLNPSTQYRVELSISGFHQLEGATSGNFTTADQTEILNFSAVAGPEDGSVILSFTVNGPEANNWTVAYSTGNSPETTQSFTGHTVTVTDLIVGNEYLFRLIPNDAQYLIGTWQLRYTAQQIVYAQELAIRSCSGGTLVAVWNVPEGLEGQSWNVRCYNGNGYDQTITTTDCQAQFTELDHAYGYTVEVTAVGMTQSTTASVSANPITLNSITATAENNDTLTVNWTYTGEAPAEGWILDYTIDGGTPITVSCPENTAKITKYPGSKYEINIRPVGEVTCFGQHLSHEVAKAQKFANYGVTADDMSFYMCLTPNKANWDRFDVPAESYKKSFNVGEKASFLVEVWKNYQDTDNKVTITYIIRNEDGQPISLNRVDSNWEKMWSKKFCELDIPQMPETAGKYSVEIYFNNQIVTTEEFSIT